MKANTEMLFYLHKQYMQGKGFSKSTVDGYSRGIRAFFKWLDERQKKHDFREVNKEDLYAYQVYLYEAQSVRKINEKRFKPSTQKAMLSSLKLFFRFLSRNDYLIRNPFDRITIDIITVDHIRESLPEKVINDFLDSFNLETIRDITDLALFELMYGTGLRVGEVCRLNVTDVDMNTGRLMVNEGKGNKDRIVPLGKNVITCLKLYLAKAREELIKLTKTQSDSEALFLNSFGRRIRIATISRRLRQRFDAFNSETKKICPHMLRHSFATHILENGAGLKHVKEILGHKCIETTVRYTHFSIQSMKRIIKVYHPRENELYLELTTEEKERIQNILKS